MGDALWAAALFLLFSGAAAGGHAVWKRLPVDHRTRDTADHTRLVSSLLVTFTALVLGLLVSTVSAGFQKAGEDLQAFGADLIRLTQALDIYGPPTRSIREDLRRYTAGALNSTWPEEGAPAGTYPVAIAGQGGDFDADNLGALLQAVRVAIVGLDAADPVHQAMRGEALTRLESLEDRRWTLIGEAHHGITTQFLAMLVFWLVLIFAGFGLNAPPTPLTMATVGLVSLSVAAAFFVLLELDGPLDGLVKVSSEPMHHALRHLDRSLARS